VARLSEPAAPERILLVEFPPGFAVPAHAHVGVERVVVLGGGFSLEGVGDHEVGDVSWTDGPHGEVRVHEGGPCRTLFVNDGPLATGRWLVDRVFDALLMR
jgi:putative transcriptional regulator